MWNTTKHLSSSTHESSRPSALPPPSSSSGCSGADYDGSLGALLEEWADFTPTCRVSYKQTAQRKTCNRCLRPWEFMEYVFIQRGVAYDEGDG